MNIDNLRNDIKNNNFNDFKKKFIKIKENNKNFKFSDNEINDLAIKSKKLSYVINLINHSINYKFINQKGFLKKITNEINDTTNFNFSTLDTYTLMKEAISKKTYYNDLLDNKQFSNNHIIMKGGFVGNYLGWDEDTTTFTKVLDVISLILDIIGIIPGVGIVIDFFNVLISLLRGKYVLAGIGVISIIPIIGTLGPALKIGYLIFTASKPEGEEDYDDDDDDDDDDDEDDEDDDYDDEDDEDD